MSRNPKWLREWHRPKSKASRRAYRWKLRHDLLNECPLCGRTDNHFHGIP